MWKLSRSIRGYFVTFIIENEHLIVQSPLAQSHNAIRFGGYLH